MKPDRTCWLILNPVSGAIKKAKHILNEVHKKFKEFPGIKYEVIYTEYAGHATEIAVSAAKNHVDQVIAVGGDGTLNETASGLVNTGTALSLIPTGSGNGFARSLGIPLNLKKTVRRIVQPEEVLIDVGKLNDSFFFGVAGVGLDAIIGAGFQNFGVRGPIPYFYIGLKEYFKFDYKEMTVIFEEKSVTYKPLLITIANTMQYGNGAIIAPMADFMDGLLEVCIIEKFPLYKAPFQLPRLFNGTINQFKYYRHYKSGKFIIRREKPGCYHTDGEPHKGPAELKFSVLPKALKVWK